MNITEQTQAKKRCYNRAQEIATALDLCASQEELQATLDELGFALMVLESGTENITVKRGEWRKNDIVNGQAIYVDCFYGVVKVVDYMQHYVDATVLLSEQAGHNLAHIWYNHIGNSGVVIK